MSDEEYLRAQREALAQSVAFFAAKNKGEREVWVARAFLQNMNIPFSDQEIILAPDDPPDVVFHDAQFEIKEIMDPNRRRHAEFKEALEKARAATSPSELATEYTPKDITLQELYELVASNSSEYQKNYATNFCNTLDLLFYVNLIDVTALIQQDFEDRKVFEQCPWRSISFVMGYHAGVLHSAPNAPEFIRNGVGKISLRAGV